jgi:hypothetical protein
MLVKQQAVVDQHATHRIGSSAGAVKKRVTTILDPKHETQFMLVKEKRFYSQPADPQPWHRESA